MSRLLFLYSIFLVGLFNFTKCDYMMVVRKHCMDVNIAKCTIHSVSIDPCMGWPEYCRITRNEKHRVAVNFTTHFSAQSLKVAMYADEQDDGVYEQEIVPADDGCNYTPCPVEEEKHQVLELKFKVTSKTSSGKYPVKLRFWSADPDHATDACCLTFKISAKESATSNYTLNTEKQTVTEEYGTSEETSEEGGL